MLNGLLYVFEQTRKLLCDHHGGMDVAAVCRAFQLQKAPPQLHSARTQRCGFRTMSHGPQYVGVLRAARSFYLMQCVLNRPQERLCKALKAGTITIGQVIQTRQHTLSFSGLGMQGKNGNV